MHAAVSRPSRQEISLQALDIGVLVEADGIGLGAVLQQQPHELQALRGVRIAGFEADVGRQMDRGRAAIRHRLPKGRVERRASEIQDLVVGSGLGLQYLPLRQHAFQQRPHPASDSVHATPLTE